ncbi:hypothetical protein RJ640_026679 [Escallonia rubra]|uniref:Retrovirus-related Pol polyprotein from transposon TNT 1-94 n=1 Tax=Escallonia rubra TaxID=112253 RepID=A0AA88R170_9ASTE|nr:hypothetical protein RJ640_026679 [Escallonia rubra]
MSNNTTMKYACEQFDGKTNLGIWQSMVNDILVCIDVKLEEEDQAIFLLSSLPKSYETLKTTLLVGKETLLVDDTLSALMDSSRVNGMSSSSQGEGLVVRTSLVLNAGIVKRLVILQGSPERKEKKNIKKHVNNADVAEKDDKNNDGDLYLVSPNEQQECNLLSIELYEQREKSADESTDGSVDEQSLEDPDEHLSDSWNLVRYREPHTKKPTQRDSFGADPGPSFGIRWLSVRIRTDQRADFRSEKSRGAFDDSWS